MQFLSAETASQQSTEDVIQHLRADPQAGLHSAEADRRLRVHGHNDFEITKEEPLWKKYLDQVIDDEAPPKTLFGSFQMVVQLIQNLVWIFPNGSTANTKPCLDTSKW